MKILKKIKNKQILLVILLGLILRFYKIKQRFFFGTEQSASLWPIVKIWQERKITLIGQHSLTLKTALFRPPFYIYIFALPLKIFNFNPLVLEIIFSLIGVTTIFILYQATEKIFNQKTAIISALLYSISFSIINFDKNIWVVTPIIAVSALVLLLFAKIPNINTKKNSLYFFLIGCLVGLGFSFHYQAGIILIALLLLSFKKQSFKNLTIFIAGAISFLSPLIFFNLRHNFIMTKGLKNIFLSSGNHAYSLSDKLILSFKSFSELSLQIANLKYLPKHPIVYLLIFCFFFLIPYIIVSIKNKTKLQKKFCKYFLFCCFFSFVALFFINPFIYTTSNFYLWYFIPLLLITWSRALLIIFKNKFFLLVIFLLPFFVLNLYSLIKQKPGNYQKTVNIVDYILTKAEKKKIEIKFINREVLAYDYIFYYRVPFYGRRFSDLNLLEQWHSNKADFFVIHGAYDWQKDKYKLKPYKKIVNFDKVKIIVK